MHPLEEGAAEGAAVTVGMVKSKNEQQARQARQARQAAMISNDNDCRED